jgi:hypothetical protein
MIPEKVIEDLQEDIVDFQAELESLEGDLDNVIMRANAKSSSELIKRIRSQIRKDFDTHTDRETTSLLNWRIEPKGKTHTIYTKAPHARAHEYGSGIYAGKGEYDITPNGNYPLKISNWDNYDTDSVDGETPDVFYFDKVSHPGVEGKHFLQKVWNKYAITEDKVVSNIDDELQDSIERNLDG